MKLYDLDGNAVSDITINTEKFCNVRLPLLRKVVNLYEANEQCHIASTKTRSEVAGSGKKPFAQKHLGRARAGSKRSPVWRGGGVTFGPKPRNVRFKIVKKERRLALNSAITSKINDEEITIIENINLETPSTKTISNLLKNLNINKTCLIIIPEYNESIWKSARNISNVKVKNVKELNAYHVVSQKRVLITKDALEMLNND